MLRQAFQYLSRSFSAATKKRYQPKKSVRLDIETLELRWLPAAISIASSTYSVSESTRYLDLVVNLDSTPTGTVTVDYATSDGSASAGLDYTAANGTLTFGDLGFSYETTKTIRLKVIDDDASESSETFTLTLSNPTGGYSLGSPSSSTITITNASSGWSAIAQQRVADTEQAYRQNFGTATYTMQTGNVSVSHGFDYGQGGAVFDQPALVYQADTTSVRPVVQALLTTSTLGDTISTMQARLTWNGGSPQSWVTFTKPGIGSSANWVFGQQVASAVSSTGLYPYTIEVTVNFSNTGSIVRTVTGNAQVVVNNAAFGKGWNIDGFDKLVSVTGGMLYVYGSGGSRLFTGSGGTYTSPANDMGTLVKNGDNTYTYTDKHQNVWNFDTSGNLATMVDPHSLIRTFTYSSGNLSTVAEPDGGVTTFTYSSGKLATIVQPGNRTITITVDGSSNLTSIADGDSSLRTFTYDGNSDLTNEKWGLLNTTFTYDSTTALLTSINRGSGVTMTLDSNHAKSLTTTPAITQANSEGQNGFFTDAQGQLGTYTLDTQGRVLYYKSNIGANFAWTEEGFGGDSFLSEESTYNRNAAGSVTSIVTVLGSTYNFDYDAKENLTSVIRPDTSRVTYTYDSTFNWITSKKNSLNNLTTYTYNGTGDLTSVQNALSQRTTFTYTSGLLETVKDALNSVTTYSYDGNRRVQAIIDALGNRSTLTYDSSGNVATVKDALSRVTTGTYDAKHRLLTVTDALSGISTYTYNAQGQVTSLTDPLGTKTSFIYDAQGRQTEQVDAVGNALERTTTYTWDTLEQITSVVNPLNKTTTYSFTSTGWMQYLTMPLNLTTTFTYNGAGQVLSETNPLNQITTFTYDGRGYMTSVSNALGNRVTFTYDTEGNRLTAQLPNGTVTYTYDALNRVIAMTDALSHTVTAVYDAVGNVQANIDAAGNRTTFTYDANHQVISVTNALNNITTYTYDTVGNLTTVKDALNNVTTFVYDELHHRVNTIEPNGSKTTYMYDASGQMTGMIDPLSNRTTFVYDVLGRQTNEIDALNKTTTFTYNAGDQLTQKKDRLTRTIDFTYDDDGRITGQIWKNSGGSTTNTVTYTYDNADRLLTARDGQGAYTFTYDAAGQVLTQRDMWATALTFTYDATGNRTNLKDNFGGLETTTYDAANRLTSRKFSGISSTQMRTDITYTARNQRETINRYSDLTASTMIGSTSYSYDSVGQVTNLQYRNGGGTSLSNYTYTYDSVGQITLENLGGTLTTFAYNSRGLITDDSTHTYTWDNASNRTSNSATYGTGNRLASDSSYNYTYDDEGNLTQKVSVNAPTTTWTYDYDANNRLTSIIETAGSALYRATYTYDVFNRRIKEVEDADGAGAGASVETRFSYDRDRIWADLDNSNALKVRYVRGDDDGELFGRVKGNGDAAWYYADAWGSTRQMVDGSGAVSNTVTYDAFGNIIGESGAAFGDRWKFRANEFNEVQSIYTTVDGISASSESGRDISNNRQYGKQNGNMDIGDITHSVTNEPFNIPQPPFVPIPPPLEIPDPPYEHKDPKEIRLEYAKGKLKLLNQSFGDLVSQAESRRALENEIESIEKEDAPPPARPRVVITDGGAIIFIWPGETYNRIDKDFAKKLTDTAVEKIPDILSLSPASGALKLVVKVAWEVSDFIWGGSTFEKKYNQPDFKNPPDLPKKSK